MSARNAIVYGWGAPLTVARPRGPSQRLMEAMMAEFKRNGGQMLTHERVRQLRRQISRPRRAL